MDGDEDGKAKNSGLLEQSCVSSRKKLWNCFFSVHFKSIQNDVLFVVSFVGGCQEI